MTIRIEFPFDANFEMDDPGNNSREIRSHYLQNYLLNSGMELGHPIEDFQVTRVNGDDNGEFWEVQVKR